MQEVMVSGT